MMTAKSMEAFKPRAKPYKKADAKGLYVIVRPDGAKWWRFKYRFGGREKTLSLGTFPDVSLARAREKRDEFRQFLDQGIDPSAKRRAEKRAQANTFEAIAEEWFEHGCPPRKAPLDSKTTATLRRRLEKFAYPEFGKWPIDEIGAKDLLRVIRRIESKGHGETARRVRSAVGRIIRYAISTERAERDVSADLRDALAPADVSHFAAVTDAKKFGELLRAIDNYSGQPVTTAGLKVLALTFVRPGELRMATWGEIDLEAEEAQWDIPAERTKLRRPHIVPLSQQAVDVLKELARLTRRGADSLVFPSLRPGRPLSSGTMNAALRVLGYGSETHVSHGFRSTASTLLHELGYSSEVIETQLAHARPGVGGIYNRSHLLTQRRKLMTEWADYLDGLKAGANVTAIRGSAR